MLYLQWPHTCMRMGASAFSLRSWTHDCSCSMPSRRSFQLALFSLLVVSSPTSSASFSSTSALERLPICRTHTDFTAAYIHF